MEDKESTFNLNEKRMEFYRELCKKYPNCKWGMIFDKIKTQDKEFIKLIENDLSKFFLWDKEMVSEINARIDKLAGDDLI